MEIKKRFRNKFIWRNDWYMNLNPHEKLFWDFIYDDCDNIGVWEPNIKLAEFHIGQKIDSVQFFKKVNKGKERLIKLEDGSWFIPDFTRFQYADGKKGTLCPTNAAHKSYLKLMIKRGLWEFFCEYYPVMMQKAVATDCQEILEMLSKWGLRRPLEGNKEQEKEIETNKEQEKEKVQVLSVSKPTIHTNKAVPNSNNLMQFYKESEQILQAYPKACKESESITIIGNISLLIEKLSQYEEDPVTNLLEQVLKLDPKTALPPSEYFEKEISNELIAEF